jgi:delta(3,5)-delta(2,4)-dienoyl-CoA isomerase
VPVICSIQGYCIGAGIDLSSACDIRLCTKDTKFNIKEVDIGICADLGTIQRFGRVVSSDSWARELAYTARYFGGEEAYHRGFVSNVYSTIEEMHNATQQLAETIASKSPVAIHTTKKSILYSRDHSVAEGMDHIALLNGAMLQTSDTKTAVMANMTKTKPVFAKL